VGLERGPLSLVSAIEGLLGRKYRGSSLEHREYCRGDPSRWPHNILYPQQLAQTSPKNGGRSVAIVRSRTQATEFVLFVSSILPLFYHNEYSYLGQMADVYTSLRRILKQRAHYEQSYL
jgi:hypothetical protein